MLLRTVRNSKMDTVLIRTTQRHSQIQHQSPSLMIWVTLQLRRFISSRRKPHRLMTRQTNTTRVLLSMTRSSIQTSLARWMMLASKFLLTASDSKQHQSQTITTLSKVRARLFISSMISRHLCHHNPQKSAVKQVPLTLVRKVTSLLRLLPTLCNSIPQKRPGMRKEMSSGERFPSRQH